MTDTKIPTSTPFSVYCQARAVVAMGREYPTSMCGNDPRLLFAALKGVDDAKRREVETYAREEFPREAEILQAVDKAFGCRADLDSDARMVILALGLRDRESVSLIWDAWPTAEGDERRIVDVIIGGRFRPTRATWQKLIDAGLPMCSWEEVFESWDLEAVNEPRETDRVRADLARQELARQYLEAK